MVGAEPSRLEASGCSGLPGAPAAAGTEGEAPGHSQLPLAALSPQNTAAVQHHPRPAPQLLPLPRGYSQGAGCQLQLVSGEAHGPCTSPAHPHWVISVSLTGRLGSGLEASR